MEDNHAYSEGRRRSPEEYGKHDINALKADNWIKAQKTPLKRKVADFLIKNTHHVSFKEYFNGIGTLISKNYPKIIKNAKNIIMYVGSTTKSTYFTAIIAMYWIKFYKYREPTIFYKALTADNITDPILYIDDMSYSGSQISDMSLKIYKNCVGKYVNGCGIRSRAEDNHAYSEGRRRSPEEYGEEAAKKVPKIHFLLYGINTVSKKKITNLFPIVIDIEEPIVKFGKTLLIKKRKLVTLPSPFKLYYVKYFKTLHEINAEMSYLVNYFFSPYLNGYPLLSVYFDHKIADDSSTFMKVIVYGPIIPKCYSLASREENYAHFQQYFGQEEEGAEAKYVTDKVISGLEKTEIMKIIPNLIEKYSSEDPYDANDTRIQFLPFINNCVINNDFIEKIEEMSYNEFLFPEDFIPDMPPPPKEIIERSKIIHDNDNKCIVSFYKKDLCTKSPRQKSRKTNTTRKTISPYTYRKKSYSKSVHRKTPKTI